MYWNQANRLWTQILLPGWEDKNTALLETPEGSSFSALDQEEEHPFLSEQGDSSDLSLPGVMACVPKEGYFSYQAAKNAI